MFSAAYVLLKELQRSSSDLQRYRNTGKRETPERREGGDVMYNICKAKGKTDLLVHSQWYLHRSSWLFLMMYPLTASITSTSAFRNLSHHRQRCTGRGKSDHRVMLYLKNAGSFLPSS